MLAARGVAIAGESSPGSDVAALQARAQALHLAESPLWAALLHATHGRVRIADPTFLLSQPRFSLARELDQTIALLYGPDQGAVCRFPARYLWLRDQAGFPPLPLHDCAQVREFDAGAPADELDLMFASENITTPASMLGHAFLALRGSTAAGRRVEHGVSFFTDDVDTYNLPVLFYRAMVAGKRGLFALNPLQEQLQQYVRVEQRSLWRYTLDLSAAQIERVRMHLLELKQTTLTYYFQSYNCATLINFVLAVANPAIDTEGWWVTPAEVTRRAKRAGMIRATTVYTPSRTLVRELVAQLPAEDIRAAREAVETGTELQLDPTRSTDQGFTRWQLASAYNHYALQTHALSETQWSANQERLQRLGSGAFAGRGLQMADLFDPVNTPPETHLTLRAGREDRTGFVAVSLLPVSHDVDDDNRQRSNENALTLFGATLRMDAGSARVVLDQLRIYGIASYTPYDSLSGGLSGSFSLGVERRYAKGLAAVHPALVQGSFGFDIRPATDIDSYMTIGLEAGLCKWTPYASANVEVGLIARLIWDMKAWLYVRQTYTHVGQDSIHTTFNGELATYLSRNASVLLQVVHRQSGRDANDVGSLALRAAF